MNYRAAEIVSKLIATGFEGLEPSKVHSAFLEMERDEIDNKRRVYESDAEVKSSKQLIEYHKERCGVRDFIIGCQMVFIVVIAVLYVVATWKR